MRNREIKNREKEDSAEVMKRGGEREEGEKNEWGERRGRETKRKKREIKVQIG